MFQIDPAFLTTSQPIGDLRLCHVRLQDDARWPWLLLIPRVEAARELEDLSVEDRVILMAEIVLAGQAVRAISAPVQKLNVGALGNITPQLHIHVVGRWPDDPAWPGPVWGIAGTLPYEPQQREVTIASVARSLDFKSQTRT